ncbi:MAG: NADP-dependent oxidoreductase [Labilithrix sp.]|nr:NADP-dependent oxidoreductase [Labilithrix sp.]
MHSPHGDGGTEQLRIEEIDPPRPGPGELLIDVAAAAVTPADIKFRSGVFKDMMPLSLPFVLGADFAGTVRAVGEGVHGSRVGEKVMGMVSVLRGGAYAEQMVVGAGEAAPVPDGLDLADAAALPMGVLTGDDLIERGLNVRAGERVMVTGAAGSVGRAAVYSAAERGAQVLAVVRSKPQPPISGASTPLVLQERGALVERWPSGLRRRYRRRRRGRSCAWATQTRRPLGNRRSVGHQPRPREAESRSRAWWSNRTSRT